MSSTQEKVVKLPGCLLVCRPGYSPSESGGLRTSEKESLGCKISSNTNLIYQMPLGSDWLQSLILCYRPTVSWKFRGAPSVQENQYIPWCIGTPGSWRAGSVLGFQWDVESWGSHGGRSVSKGVWWPWSPCKFRGMQAGDCEEEAKIADPSWHSSWGNSYQCKWVGRLDLGRSPGIAQIFILTLIPSPECKCCLCLQV